MKSKTTSEKPTQVKHKQVTKLTPDDLKKITGGIEHRDCTGPGQPTCLAYLVYP
jgi:hypothetical protein